MAAVDFFTAEVWTSAGLITYHVLAFMRVGSRQGCIAGLTASPDQARMKQMARNMTWADTGFPCGCGYLLHDRDAKFCTAFDAILEAVGIQAIKLPPRSPNLNVHCERWIRSIKAEVLSKMILFGERSFRHCLPYLHAERNHQAKDNVILIPTPEEHIGQTSGPIQTRERLGGILKFLLSRGCMSFLTMRVSLKRSWQPRARRDSQRNAEQRDVRENRNARQPKLEMEF